MKRRYLSDIRIIALSTLIFCIQSCQWGKSKEDTIVGEWKAHWETSVDESLMELDETSLKMDGTIRFMEDGKVEIAAFGFDGCIFSSDTMSNVLSWQLDDTVLRFIDKQDDHGLPYTINKFSRNELKLTLLEDINLTLSRN